MIHQQLEFARFFFAYTENKTLNKHSRFNDIQATNWREFS